jgi:purine-binding chemotaxis protein CheW
MLGGRPFAVDVADAREVVELDATTPVPGAPAPVIGVMNLRGNVLPIVEARPLLGLPVRAPVDQGRALVLADGERRAAILIERVLGLAAFEVVHPPAAGDDGRGLVVGELTAEGGTRATLLDGPALLAALRRPWDPGPGG